MLTKKLFSRIAVLLFLLIVFGTVHCAVQFQYDSEQCLGELVEYQCTVTGSLTLTWRILQEDGTQFGLIAAYTSGGISVPATIEGVFNVEQLSSSPSIVSNISFTVQSSINGYTIICQDINENNENLTIQITGPPPPPPPNSLSLSFSQNESVVNWIHPKNSQCIVSNTVSTTSTIITSTDTSVTIPLAGLSPGIYCVSVASVDTANRTGTYSEEECRNLQEPEAPVVVSCNYSSGDSNGSSAMVLLDISWTFAEIIPPLTMVCVNVSEGFHMCYGAGIDTAQIAIQLNTEEVYNVIVYGKNVLGPGQSETIKVIVPANGSVTQTECFIASATTSSLPTNLEPSSSPTLPPSPTPSSTLPTAPPPTPSPTPPAPTHPCPCPWWCILLIVLAAIGLYCICKITISGSLLECRRRRKKSKTGPPTGHVELHVSGSEKPPVPSSSPDHMATSKADTPDIYSKATEAETDMEYAELGLQKKNKNSAGKKNHPQPKDSAETDNVQYSALKQEVQYVDLSHTKAPFRRPPPQQTTVDYAAIAKH